MVPVLFAVRSGGYLFLKKNNQKKKKLDILRWSSKAPVSTRDHERVPPNSPLPCL